jgi:hypothetical protein
MRFGIRTCKTRLRVAEVCAVNNREDLEFLGNRRDCQAASAGDIADDHVDVLARDQVAVLGHDIAGRASFIDQHHLDRGVAEPFALIRRRDRAGVEASKVISAALRPEAHGPGTGAGQIGDDTNSDRSGFLRPRALRAREEQESSEEDGKFLMAWKEHS